MKKDLRIDVRELEHRPVEFDLAFTSKELDLPDNWSLPGELRAEGSAELLDHSGSRTLRVKGRLEGQVAGECARCLTTFTQPADQNLDLYFYPADAIDRSEEVAVSADDLDYGFYEDNGILLSEVVGEQLQLWLPMRPLCREDCRGICPECGGNRNEKECSCEDRKVDPRWEALQQLKRN
ncbi:MAG: DUF177 domain-containing protein [Acidobacteria bacterium]|nr:DUF177 domain-containing protein [Acidobacteriota bacterium]